MASRRFSIARVFAALLILGFAFSMLVFWGSCYPEMLWTAHTTRHTLLFNAEQLTEKIETFTKEHDRPPQTRSEFEQPEGWPSIEDIARASRGRLNRPMSRAIIPEAGGAPEQTPLLVISNHNVRLEFYRSGTIGASGYLIPRDMIEIRGHRLVRLSNEGWEETGGVSWALTETGR